MNLKLSFLVSVLLVSPVFLAGCGGPATIPVTVIRMTATRPAVTNTPAPPTATSAPGATSAPQTATSAPQPPQATSTEAGETVKFEFVTSLSTIEELEPILMLVEEFDGVLGASGSQVDITITYDPSVTTVEMLQQRMEEIGQAVKLP